MVTALRCYADVPVARRWGLWTLPFFLGCLEQAAGAHLSAAAHDVDRHDRTTGRASKERRSAASGVGLATVVALLSAWWLAAHTPATHVTGASSPLLYVLSQPWVTLRYLGAFVAPVGLSADNDWPLVFGWADARVWLGLLAVAGLIWLGEPLDEPPPRNRTDCIRGGVVHRGDATHRR